MTLALETARTIIQAAAKKGREMGLKPLTITVVDAGGATIAMERQDGSSPIRPKVAYGKANGAVQVGMGARGLMNRAEQQPFFMQSLNALCGGDLVPVPGGVLIRDGEGGAVLGAVGISGDTSDNDEAAAIAGIGAAGLTADGG